MKKIETRKVVFILLIMTISTGTANCRGNKMNGHICQLPQKFIFQEQSPGFDPGVFESRRKRLLNKTKGDISIISSATGNDFIYLTGLPVERQSIAVIDSSSDKPFTLFVVPSEPTATLWDGEIPGVKGAIEQFGADTAYTLDKFDQKLAEISTAKQSVSVHSNDMLVKEKIRKLPGDATWQVHSDLAKTLHEMRVIKDEWEIGQLKKAIEVTALAHKRALQTTKPGQKEYDVQAEIEYVFRKNGLTTGFPSITGSGPNATILHYNRNNRTLQCGDLLLMDIGAEAKGYAADITRTIPVSGKFSDEQRELYSLVLKANQEAIKKMVPGNHILDCHHRATEIIVRGLYDKGLITDTTSWWQKRFYIHYRNNHYIGLHVHDVGSYGNFDESDRDAYILNPLIIGRELQPGMVMTIEPGIYLLADRLDHLHGLFGDRATADELDSFAEIVRPVYEKYSNIGIRIEDDVLITGEGNIVLSQNAPKTIKEIEAAMSNK